ncbi:MAG TPA: hypothetical protein VM680_18470 [Verrucomicrobiae bacterium]|nr:hypothetical protein [Verrucomicrobiae bacterium]
MNDPIALTLEQILLIGGIIALATAALTLLSILAGIFWHATTQDHEADEEPAAIAPSDLMDREGEAPAEPVGSSVTCLPVRLAPPPAQGTPIHHL